MTTPDVPLRLELTFEVPGTPEQVWDAIATGKGITAWMMPTDLEEREGGAVGFHMGSEVVSKGIVTGWDPPRRFEYTEPDWAEFTGNDAASVTPLVSEFLVEATSGGTCVVRVVSSAFGTGADWEQEFFDGMVRGWPPMFDQLRLYLAHYQGQPAATFVTSAEVPGAPGDAMAAVRKALDVDEVGQEVTSLDATGLVERIGDDNLLIRFTAPVPGMLSLLSWRAGEDTATVRLAAHLFSADAGAYVDRAAPAWQAWLESLAAQVI